MGVVMLDDLTDLYQQVILDHCRQPRNFHELAEATCSAEGHNPLCGDQLRLYLKMDKDRIEDADRPELNFYIRNGIVVVVKNGTIPDGTVI